MVYGDLPLSAKATKNSKMQSVTRCSQLLDAGRKFQGLSALPTPADIVPLFPVHRGKGPLSSTNHVRNIVQTCFDRAIESIAEQGFKENADAMIDITVHWLRQTGISDDVKRRRREHVRDDAGHSKRHYRESTEMSGAD